MKEREILIVRMKTQGFSIFLRDLYTNLIGTSTIETRREISTVRCSVSAINWAYPVAWDLRNYGISGLLFRRASIREQHNAGGSSG